MLKRFVVASALLAAPFMASADPGCGLGQQVWGDKDGLVAHVLAATTNGTSGNQTFGMTSGTSGCDTSKPVTAAAVFMNDNMDQVAEHMATGEGETLEALAVLLQIPADQHAHFASLAQSQFGQIYSHDQITAEQAMSNLLGVMAQDAQLSPYAG